MEDNLEKEVKKVLVVDDEQSIIDVLVYNLKKEGYETIEATDGITAVNIALEQKPDLMLLDIMLPKLDGLSVCKRVKNHLNIPILMLTAKDAEIDKIVGLELGADDYITKPFNLLELIARVKSNLRRYITLGTYNNENINNKEVLISGGLELNTSTKEVKVDGQVVKVTPIEFKILNLLLANKGRVFSIDEIYEKVWNEESFNVENTVAVHIRRIREKIEINPKEPRYLKVVWGVGYKIEKL